MGQAAPSLFTLIFFFFFLCEMIEILFKKKNTDEAMKDTKWKGSSLLAKGETMHKH